MLVKVKFGSNVMPDWFEVNFEHKDTVKNAGGVFHSKTFKIPAHWEMKSRAFKALKEEIGAVKVTLKVTPQASGIGQVIFFETVGETLFSIDLARESDADAVRAFCQQTQQTLNGGKQAEAVVVLQEIEARRQDYFFRFVV